MQVINVPSCTLTAMYLFVLLAYRHHSWWRKKQFLKCFDNVIKGVLLSPLLNALDGYFGSQNPTRKVIMSSNTLIINDWHQNLILLKTFIAKTVQIQNWDQNQRQKTHSVRFTDFGKYFVDKWSSSTISNIVSKQVRSLNITSTFLFDSNS